MSFDIATLLSSITAVLVTYGYIGLFAVSFIAALALPIPSSVALAGFGALAAQGSFNIYAVLAVAFAGNVAADIFGYTAARRYGEETLLKLGFKRVMRLQGFRTLERYMHDFPQAIIYVTRLVTEAGPAVNILAGLAKVSFRTFVFFDVIGEASYVLLFGLTGYFLGDAWENNTSFLLKGVLVLISLGLAVGTAQMLLRKHARAQH